MTGRDFQSELKREEASRRSQNWSAEIAAVKRRLNQKRRSSRVLWAVALAAAAALLFVVFRRQEAPKPVESAGPFQLVAKSDALQMKSDQERVEILSGEASLLDASSGIALRSEGPLVIGKAREGVRVIRGRAEFNVRHREKPVSVLVSGGEIEIIGTRFTVEQGHESGEVTLHEGRIRFKPTKGETRELNPGSSLRWPVPAEAEPIQEAPMPAVPERSVDSLLEEVELLRGRGDYDAAAKMLSRALRSQPSGTQERLSFELGSILTYQLKDSRKACAHWRRHAARFSSPRYANEVRRARETLGCPR